MNSCVFVLLTMSLHSNSILSSGGIWEPSELASLFWLFCELFVAIAVPGVVSAPNTLSRTCSHTLRHWINSLATRRSCCTKSNGRNTFKLLWLLRSIRRSSHIYLFHTFLLGHLWMGQQIKWNFEEFWYCSLNDDVCHPGRYVVVQEGTFRFTGCITNK